MFMLFSRYWWVLVVRGVMAVIFGVVAFAYPMETVAALVLLFGAYALVDGVFSVAASIAGRKLTPHWWVVLVQGLLGIGVGALTFLNPALTAVALLAYIAVWAIAMGALHIYAAIKLRHEITGEWWIALGGILSVGFGALVMVRPGQGALAVLWLIATYAIVWGATLVMAGFDVRRLRTHAMA